MPSVVEYFYVYCYIRLDTNTPFYIGKGSGDRARDICDHNDYCKNIAKKHGCEIEFFYENLDEDKAFAKEKKLIKFFRKLGYCEANFTNGGEGPSGNVKSLETRAKMSLANKGKVLSMEHIAKISAANKGKKRSAEVRAKMSAFRKGKTHSEETKAKIGAANLNRSYAFNCKKIQCIETGIVYESIKKLIGDLCISTRTLYRNLKYGRKIKKLGLSFRYVL